MSEVRKMYSNEIVFEGSARECYTWIIAQAIENNYGIYRVWIEDGNTYWDVGTTVYIFNDGNENYLRFLKIDK